MTSPRKTKSKMQMMASANQNANVEMEQTPNIITDEPSKSFNSPNFGNNPFFGV